jgi:hypothetical protein
VWSLPALIAIALVMPRTTTGVVAHGSPLQAVGPALVPIPSWPSALSPQQSTLPLASTAQVSWPPALSARAAGVGVAARGAPDATSAVTATTTTTVSRARRRKPLDRHGIG